MLSRRGLFQRLAGVVAVAAGAKIAPSAYIWPSVAVHTEMARYAERQAANAVNEYTRQIMHEGPLMRRRMPLEIP